MGTSKSMGKIGFIRKNKSTGNGGIKRSLLAALLVLVMALLLAACGKSDDKDRDRNRDKNKDKDNGKDIIWNIGNGNSTGNGKDDGNGGNGNNNDNDNNGNNGNGSGNNGGSGSGNNGGGGNGSGSGSGDSGSGNGNDNNGGSNDSNSGNGSNSNATTEAAPNDGGEHPWDRICRASLEELDIFVRPDDDKYFKPITDDYIYEVKSSALNKTGSYYDEFVVLYSYDEEGNQVQCVERSIQSYYLDSDFNPEYSTYSYLNGDTMYIDNYECYEYYSDEIDKFNRVAEIMEYDTYGSGCYMSKPLDVNATKIKNLYALDDFPEFGALTPDTEDYVIRRYASMYDDKADDMVYDGTRYGAYEAYYTEVRFFNETGKAVSSYLLLTFKDEDMVAEYFKRQFGEDYYELAMEKENIVGNVVIDYSKARFSYGLEIAEFKDYAHYDIEKQTYDDGKIYFSVPYLTEKQMYYYPRFYAGNNGFFTYIGDGEGNICIDGYEYDDKKIVVPDTIDGRKVTAVKSLNSYNFEYTESVIIPDTVIELGAFSGMGSLNEVVLGKNISRIMPEALPGTWLKEIELPDGITELPRSSVTGFTSIKLPASLVKIGENALSGGKFTSIEIPDTVKYIDNGAFSNCENLENIRLPEGLCNIGESAFSNCTALKEIVIPDGIKDIRATFYRCSALEKVTLGRDLKYIGRSTFNGCENLKEVKMSDNVICIDDNAFSDCKSLEKIVFSDSLLKIGKYAFSGCESLADIILPDGITYIGEGAFTNCDSLTDIVLPDSLESIGKNVFNGCDNLVGVTYKGKTYDNKHLDDLYKAVNEE